MGRAYPPGWVMPPAIGCGSNRSGTPSPLGNKEFGPLTGPELANAERLLDRARQERRRGRGLSVSLVLDSGGLIAFDRGDHKVAALVEATRRRSERGADLIGVCRPSVARWWSTAGAPGPPASRCP